MLAQYTFAFSNHIDQIDMLKSFTIGFLNSDNFADLKDSQKLHYKKHVAKLKITKKVELTLFRSVMTNRM